MIAEDDKWQVAVIQSITGQWFAKARKGLTRICEVRHIHVCDDFKYTGYKDTRKEAEKEIAALIDC